MKRCSNALCTQTNPLDITAFNKSARAADGYQHRCRVCQSLANKANTTRKPTSDFTSPMYNAMRTLRRHVRQGKVTRTPCKQCGGSTNLRAYLRSPTAVPHWYCAAHHPKRSGNTTLTATIKEDNET